MPTLRIADVLKIFVTKSGQNENPDSITNNIIGSEMTIKQSPSLLGFIRPDDKKVDQETADELKNIVYTGGCIH